MAFSLERALAGAVAGGAGAVVSIADDAIKSAERQRQEQALFDRQATLERMREQAAEDRDRRRDEIKAAREKSDREAAAEIAKGINPKDFKDRAQFQFAVADAQRQAGYEKQALASETIGLRHQHDAQLAAQDQERAERRSIALSEAAERRRDRDRERNTIAEGKVTTEFMGGLSANLADKMKNDVKLNPRGLSFELGQTYQHMVQTGMLPEGQAGRQQFAEYANDLVGGMNAASRKAATDQPGALGMQMVDKFRNWTPASQGKPGTVTAPPAADGVAAAGGGSAMEALADRTKKAQDEQKRLAEYQAARQAGVKLTPTERKDFAVLEEKNTGVLPFAKNVFTYGTFPGLVGVANEKLEGYREEAERKSAEAQDRQNIANAFANKWYGQFEKDNPDVVLPPLMEQHRRVVEGSGQDWNPDMFQKVRFGTDMPEDESAIISQWRAYTEKKPGYETYKKAAGR